MPSSLHLWSASHPSGLLKDLTLSVLLLCWHQSLLNQSHGFLSLSAHRHYSWQGHPQAPHYQIQLLHLSIFICTPSNIQQRWPFSSWNGSFGFSDTGHTCFSSYFNGCSFLVSPAVFFSALKYRVAAGVTFPSPLTYSSLVMSPVLYLKYHFICTWLANL